MRRPFGIDLNCLAVNRDAVLSGAYRVRKSVLTLSGVVFEKVSEHFGACEVVDGDDFVALGAKHLSECEATDTTEAVNCNFN